MQQLFKQHLKVEEEENENDGNILCLYVFMYVCMYLSPHKPSLCLYVCMYVCMYVYAVYSWIIIQVWSTIWTALLCV